MKKSEIKVLVVDDAHFLRESIVYALEEEGYQTFEAGNGTEALALAQKHKPHIIVSDIRMPEGNGLELLNKIRAMDFKSPSIILMTGFSDLSLPEAYSAGAETMLAKPFPLDHLIKLTETMTFPKELVWENNQELPVSKSLEIMTDSLSFGDSEGSHVALGRGGVFIASENATLAVDQIVEVKIHFKHGSMKKLEFVGRIKWVRRQATAHVASGYGIEFFKLDKEAANQVIAFTDQQKVKSYIPLGEKKSVTGIAQ